ncbi:MAG: 4Fe-4S dicluster domain-containing protein, partial [Pseudomonadota bacterium]
LCFNRTKEGMPPACVKTCPTGAMQFGNRQEILDRAGKRLAEVKRIHKHALLEDPEDVRVIYLLADDPRKYYGSSG